MDLINLREAERESLEIFYAIREELHFYLKRAQLLEAIWAENGIPIPKYGGCSVALPAVPAGLPSKTTLGAAALASPVPSLAPLCRLTPFYWEQKSTGHTSITIRGNHWYDHAAEQGGGPVSFVQQFYDLSYPEAVIRLLGGEQGTVYASAPKQKKREKKAFALPPAGRDMRRMYAYLLKNRLLDRDVVSAFVRAGSLYESCETYGDMGSVS